MYLRQTLRNSLLKDRQQFGNDSLWLCFRFAPTLIAVAFLLFFMSSAIAQQSSSDSVSPNNVEAGLMLLRDPVTGAYKPAVLQASKVHFEVSGIVALVQLEQTFVNTTGEWVDAVYAFPLPETAAVRAMEMALNDRQIVGRIEVKAVAQAIYAEARAAGKKASLVEQQRPNLFTNRVANIAPDEQVTVRLEYVQKVEYHAGEFSLRFPMTITPRYMPGKPIATVVEDAAHQHIAINPYNGWSGATDQVSDADAISPLVVNAIDHAGGLRNPIEISVQLDIGVPLSAVDALYHEMKIVKSAHRYELALANGPSEMDRDFVLNWRPVDADTPIAALFTEQVGGEQFALLMVLPPARAGSVPNLLRETVFVIDTSGSMGGVSMAQARQALSEGLKTLNPRDSFNIVEFNSVHRVLFNRPVAATSHNIARALEFVRQLKAGGGTEMLPAIRAALATDETAATAAVEKIAQVVFITDGAVGNEQALFQEISDHLGEKRLFTVGIGSAPNSWFMRQSAQIGRGSYTHIGDISEVSARMTALFQQIASPQAANIQVQWPEEVETYPQRIPDLYRGEPLLIAVKASKGDLAGLVTVTGDMAGEHWSRSLQIPATERGGEVRRQYPGVSSLWARAKISDLLDLRLQGAAEASVRESVLNVALSHALLSPYTSFVAVEEQLSRQADERSINTAVPNTQPQGQSPQPFAYPATASGYKLHIWFGALLLFIAMLIYVMGRSDDYALA